MPTALSILTANRVPAIHWQLTRWLGDEPGAYERAAAAEKLGTLLACIANPLTQQAVLDDIANQKKRFGFTPKTLKTALSNAADAKPVGRPDNVDPELDADDGFDRARKRAVGLGIDWEKLQDEGFAGVNDPGKAHHGYWAMSSSTPQQISNFLITPIFQVAGKGADSRHIFEVFNGRRRAVVDVPSKALVELGVLSTELVAERCVFKGSAGHLKMIATHILDEFPLCHEIRKPGWQRDGFFAYLNHVVVPGADAIAIDRFGIFQHGDTHFLIPASSEVFANVRQDSDPYELQRMLTYTPPKVTFKEWAETFVGVFEKKGLVGIAYALLALYRDLIFPINSNCPHLYCFGERSAGKSAMAESLSYLFYAEKRTYNVNSGTDFAFFNFLGAFRNCLNHLNELDDKTLQDEWFQAIKGAFDGEGRQRGVMGKRDQSEIQHVNSALVLTGQYISTKDDNSLVSRSIIVPFSENDITDDTKAHMVKLKAMQDAGGINGLLPELLALRPLLKEKYYDTYSTILRTWREATPAAFNQRIFQNWAHLSALWQLASRSIALPVPWIEFDQYAYSQALQYSRFIRASDTLTTFWNTVASLLDKGELESGWHFRVVAVSKVRIRSSDGKTETERDLGETKKVLYIRLQLVHQLYEEDYRRRAGERGMSFENLKHYMATREYYFGQMKQHRFTRFVDVTTSGANGGMATTNKQLEAINTACYAFDYEALDCELEREDTALDGPGRSSFPDAFGQP